MKLTNQIRGMLNESEQALLRELEPERFSQLDEDGLIDLHDRVRRARTKYSKLHRRRAREQVGTDAARGRAAAVHARAAVKAEVFEDALAQVSRELARVARAAAAELKAERLAAARAARGGAPGAGGRTAGAGAVTAGRSAQVKRRTPASKKASASSRSRTRAAQAARDAR